MKKNTKTVKVMMGIIAIPTKKEKKELENATEILKTGMEDHGEEQIHRDPGEDVGTVPGVPDAG